MKNTFVLTRTLCALGMNLLEQNDADVYITNSGDPSEYRDQLAEADAIIIGLGKMDRNDIESAKKLKVIARIGVGYDTVDIEAANEYGIPVVITPGANTRSVAEHTLALIFAVSKNIVESHNQNVAGNFAIRSAQKSFELFGKTIGFIGVGNIGNETAKLCLALGMKVKAYDPYLTVQQMQQRGFIPCEHLEELLAASDIVTIHVPLTAETKGLINKDRLSKMKPASILINCSRGAIINEEDLSDALNHNRIAGAGVDVYSKEPTSVENPLLSAKNIICTPHMASVTREAMDEMTKMAIEGCYAVLRGEKYQYVASQDVYKHPRWRR